MRQKVIYRRIPNGRAPMNDLSDAHHQERTEKNKSKPRLISRSDGNERKFAIAKRRHVEYEKIAGNALSANFRFERQRRSGILMKWKNR